MAATAGAHDAIDDVRAFNRFYTRVIGVLDDGVVETSYSLPEARVLFELAQVDEGEVGEEHQQHLVGGEHLQSQPAAVLSLRVQYVRRRLRTPRAAQFPHPPAQHLSHGRAVSAGRHPAGRRAIAWRDGRRRRQTRTWNRASPRRPGAAVWTSGATSAFSTFSCPTRVSQPFCRGRATPISAGCRSAREA